MIKAKVAFLEGRLFSSQSGLFVIEWIKAGPPKKTLLFWSCEQAIIILKESEKSLPKLFFA